MAKTKVPQWKKDVVKQIEGYIKKYPIIGIINMQELPGSTSQDMRRKLRDKAEIFMAKKRLIKLALEALKATKPNLAELEKYLGGEPALIFTSENPFKLYKTIQKNKSPAPAKPGQIAPRDLILPAGPTPFTPGPMISEFSSLGVKAGVEQGKIAIKQDFMAARKGEPIKEKIAGLLTKMGIQPFEVGMNLVAVYENGFVFTQETLAIDESAYVANIEKAARWAFNLSIESAYPTKENREILIIKAFRDARAVAIEGAVLEKDVIDQLLAKASAQASSLKKDLKV